MVIVVRWRCWESTGKVLSLAEGLLNGHSFEDEVKGGASYPWGAPPNLVGRKVSTSAFPAVLRE